MGSFNYRYEGDEERLKLAKKIVRKYRAHIENHEDMKCNLGDAIILMTEEIGKKYGWIKEFEEVEIAKDLVKKKVEDAIKRYSKPKEVEKIIQNIKEFIEKRDQESLQPLWYIAFKIEPILKVKGNFEQQANQILKTLQESLPLKDAEKIINNRIEEYGL